ncbi:TssN family type VI secretion system protein [Marinifilum sp. RC60d5]|uniref:TssN family type VI secretion system protein n=1 Tax=Marinifilum sp. RC60d5 TaxID=3458414 RepID=UPI00403694AF
MILKSLLNGDVNVISILFLFFGAMFFAFSKSLKKLFSHDRKKMILYLLVAALVYAVCALFTIGNLMFYDISSNYIAIMVISLLSGYLMILALEKYFEWPEKLKWLAQLMLILVTVLVGFIVFIQIAGRFGVRGMHYFFLSATISMILPWLFLHLFNSAMDIPLAIYKMWEYPINKKYVRPEYEDLKNPYIITLEFLKSKDAEFVSRFRVRAPENMDFGMFFYHFINDYNQKHPEELIEYGTKEEKLHNWIFYRRPRFIGRWKQVNTEQTVYRNNIKENNVIVCQRLDD